MALTGPQAAARALRAAQTAPRWSAWGEDEWRQMHARMMAMPSSNHAVWEAAEADELEAFLVRFYQIARDFKAPVPGEQRPWFQTNWEDAACALRYLSGHMRARFEPVDEPPLDAGAPRRPFDLKRAILNGRVVRAYDNAPPIELEGRWFAPRHAAQSEDPAVRSSLAAFARSTHARHWVLAPGEARSRREHCPLDEEKMCALERFVLQTVKAAALILDWQLPMVLDALTYARRFWLRKWASERSRAHPHCPRALVATCMFVAAKIEGAATPRPKRAAEARKETRPRPSVPRRAPPRPSKSDESVLDRIIEALRQADGIWYTTSEAVCAFEVELLTGLDFELCAHHVHAFIRLAFGALHVRVAELAWQLATEMYASDLVFEHAPADLAYAALLAAHAHHHVPLCPQAVLCSSPEAGDRAAAAVARWLTEREARRMEACEGHLGPAESPSTVVRKKPTEAAVALSCIQLLAAGANASKRQKV